MKTKLEFHWRDGDLELKACPIRLVRFDDNEENVTIDFINHYMDEHGKEFCYSIGYFKYNDCDDYWSLYFVGDRFKEIPPEKSAELWKQLALAYDTLTEWVGKRKDVY